jgi:uncharacterized membrane protein
MSCALGTFSRYTRYHYTQAPVQASKFRCPFGLSLASASLVCQCRLLISLLTDTFEIWENFQLKSFIFGQCLNSEKLCLDLMHLSGVILLTIMMHSQFWSSYISSSHFLTFSQIPVLDVWVARLNTVTLKTVFQDMLKFISRMSTLLNMCLCHAQNLEWSNGHCLQLLTKAFQRCWCWWSMMCFWRTAS